jgi:hypothetical protein
VLALQRSAGNTAVSRVLARVVYESAGEQWTPVTDEDTLTLSPKPGAPPTEKRPDGHVYDSQTERFYPSLADWARYAKLTHGIGNDTAGRLFKDGVQQLLAIEDPWVKLITRLMAMSVRAEGGWEQHANIDTGSEGAEGEALMYGDDAKTGVVKVQMREHGVQENPATILHEQTHAVQYQLFLQSLPFTSDGTVGMFWSIFDKIDNNVESLLVDYATFGGSAPPAKVVLEIVQGKLKALKEYGKNSQGPLERWKTIPPKEKQNRTSNMIPFELLSHFSEMVVKVAQSGADMGYLYGVMAPLLNFLTGKFTTDIVRRANELEPLTEELDQKARSAKFPPTLEDLQDEKRVEDARREVARLSGNLGGWLAANADGQLVEEGTRLKSETSKKELPTWQGLIGDLRVLGQRVIAFAQGADNGADTEAVSPLKSELSALTEKTTSLKAYAFKRRFTEGVEGCDSVFEALRVLAKTV